jgi:hypothetical protein
VTRFGEFWAVWASLTFVIFYLRKLHWATFPHKNRNKFDKVWVRPHFGRLEKPLGDFVAKHPVTLYRALKCADAVFYLATAIEI